MRVLTCAFVMASVAIAMAASAASAQDIDPTHQAAYERWRTAVESYPNLQNPFWYRSDLGGPADLRAAVDRVVSYGPNLVPFLVSEIRREGDYMRLYRLLGLLKRVAGIDLFFESGVGEYQRGVNVLKARFLEDWDAGRYVNPTTLLKTAWQDPTPGPNGSVDPKGLAPVLRFGVFALPFIAEELELRNSAPLFAAFLNITYQMDRYRSFQQRPAQSFARRQDKAAAVRQWARDNGPKVSRLNGLREQIAALAAK